MFDNKTTIVDRRTTKQEVSNHQETIVEAAGNIVKTEEDTRFISFDKKSDAYKTAFSSEPYYIECVEKDYKYYDNSWGYEVIKTRVDIKVKQVLIVGSIFTLEVVELSKKDASDKWNSGKTKGEYYNKPTIL